MRYTIKQLADLSGVTVRTLHYYDQIGLLKPSFHHENGYRFYEQKEVEKLQQILFFRELEFPLARIQTIVNSDAFDKTHALKDQKILLQLKKRKLEQLITIIENSLKGGEQPMTDHTQFDPFKDKDYLQYKEEVQERWGNTDAYKQSLERIKKWTKEDLQKIKREGQDITLGIADTMDHSIDSNDVQSAIQKHFNHMQQFYDCSYDMYKNLGKMYVEDQRFTAFYEKIKPGLAIFMRDAMAYFADHQK